MVLLLAAAIGTWFLLGDDVSSNGPPRPDAEHEAHPTRDLTGVLTWARDGPDITAPVEPIHQPRKGKAADDVPKPYLIHGSLRDPQDKPVRAADVVVTDASGTRTVVHVDRAGNFVFETATAGRYALLAQAYTWCQRVPVSCTVDPRSPVAHRNLYLVPPGYITGKASWSHGGPLRQVAVEAIPLEEIDRHFGREQVIGRSKTGTDGSFRIGPLHPERVYALWLGGEDSVLLVQHAGDTLGDAQVELVYDPYSSPTVFAGWVLDRDTESAIPGARVEIMNSDTRRRLPVTTQHGFFLSAIATADELFVVWAEAPGYEPQVFSLHPDSAMVIRLQPIGD